MNLRSALLIAFLLKWRFFVLDEVSSERSLEYIVLGTLTVLGTLFLFWALIHLSKELQKSRVRSRHPRIAPKGFPAKIEEYKVTPKLAA